MTEDVNKLLSIPEEPNKDKSENFKLDADKTEDEWNLKIFATVSLVIGIIASIVLFFSIGLVSNPAAEGTDINISGLAISIFTCLSSVGSYYFLIVISNISTTLKEIRYKGTKL